MTVNNQTYLWTRPLKYTPSPIRFFRISPHQNHSVSTKPIIAYSFHVVFTTPLHKTCNRKRYVSTSIHRLYRHTRIVYKYHYLGNRSIYIYIYIDTVFFDVRFRYWSYMGYYTSCRIIFHLYCLRYTDGQHYDITGRMHASVCTLCDRLYRRTYTYRQSV